MYLARNKPALTHGTLAPCLDPSSKPYAGKRGDAKGGRHYAPPGVWKKAPGRVGADGIAASRSADWGRGEKIYCAIIIVHQWFLRN